jgi:hypothetical protein
LEIAMHVSDILLECARECARLSRECRDEKAAASLFALSRRLLAAVTREAELIIEDNCAARPSDPPPVPAART